MIPRLVTSILFITFFAATSVEQKQGCDINQEVYKNPSRSDMLVKMEFTDGCQDADSYVYAYDASNKQTAVYTVPDMKTKIFHIDVPAGGSIKFNCRGTGHNTSGACSSRLISADAE
jgi:hypothetical protein